MTRKATAGRPGVPGAFSGPSRGARRLHKSSGICHIVGTAVLVGIASLPYLREVYPIRIALSGFRTDSNLDFIHLERALKAERQVCKLALTLVPKEVRHAHCPCRSDTADCKICPRIFQARLGTRPSIGGRGTARARQTHGDRRVAGHGAKPGAAVSEVSSRAEPGAVVESSTSARAVSPVGAHLCGRRAGRDWGGRYLGAAAGGKDQSQGHLSRSGAVVALARREGQWVTLALRDAAARDSVGGTGLGLAVSDRLVSLGAVSPAAGPTPQNVTAMGRATDGVDTPLAPGTGGCRGGR